MSHVMRPYGAREVSREELDLLEAPPPAGRWYPLKHSRVLETVVGTLAGAGFAVEQEQLAVSRHNHRFFGTLDLSAPVAPGIHLAVGIRNSTDQSFPLGFCAGNRVTVCDNLLFHSELLVTRKHTKHGHLRFEEGIAESVQGLRQFQQAEGERIAHFQAWQLSEDAANSYLLQAFEQSLITSPLLPKVIQEWRHPQFEEFKPRTMFSLLNAFTSAFQERRDRSPAQYAAQTMRLQRFLLSKEVVN